MYRGATLADGTPVILKTLRHAFPSPAVLRALRHEHRILSEISIEGVAKTYGLHEQDGRLLLLLEDFGGMSLAEACKRRRLSTDAFFDVAILLAQAVAHVHQAGIIHKDISPANIVWNTETGRAKLIDFGISARASRDRAPTAPRELQGTLAYISPEQTGRTHRHIDSRSDLYSLGCTLYEALLGHPPFHGTDASQLVHAHLAVAPRAPREVDAGVPEMLSRIIVKLLEKNAEDRYQSAFGLASDIARARDAYRAGDAESIFELGRDDVLHRFRIPDRLYGRERESAWLLERFAETVAGRATFCAVSGYSGIGKTSLVEEVQSAIVERRGAFLSGKFDQFKRGVPYASLIEACQNFTRQLLGQPAEVTAHWRERILDATAPNTQVLLDVIPDLLPLLGAQPEVPALPIAEAENRLNVALGRFVRSLAEPSRPLVLFLDDLQWADLSSLHLVERLVTDTRSAHLLVIGAYRDNDVGAAHPLTMMLERLSAGDHAASMLNLGPLGLADTQALIADAQRQSTAAVKPLAELCMEKTGGNPFFLNQFLEGLHERGLLRFDLEAGTWQWDLEDIKRQGFTDNVVEFMTAKVERLPEAAREALMVASVIGNVFDVSKLASLLTAPGDDANGDAERREDATLAALEPSRREGLIYLDEGDVVTGRFVHDRVQQSAYELLSEARRKRVHLELGTLLRDAYLAGEAEALFEATNHLNAAIDIIEREADRLGVARLNLEAAIQARTSAAYGAAKRHAHAGLSLLAADAYRTDYRLATDLRIEGAEADFLTGDYASMERNVESVIANATDAFDEVRAHEVRVAARNARNDLLGAVEANLAALARLGFTLPTQPSQGAVMAQLVRTKLALHGRTVASIASLPEARDARTVTAARLMMNLIGPAYYASPNLLPITAFTTVRLTLEHGVCPESATAFSLYGLVLVTLGDLEGAYAFGQVAMAIAERFDRSRHATRARHLYNTHVRIFKEPWHRSADALLSTHERAYADGDFEYAAFSGFMRCALLGASGRDLDDVTSQMARMAAALTEMKQTTSGLTLGIVRQAALNLRGASGASETPWQLIGDAYDERVIVQQHRDASDTTNLFCYLTTRMRLAYLFGQYREAFDAAKEAAPLEAAATATHFACDALFFEALTRIRIEDSLSVVDRVKNRARLLVLERRVAKLADAGPMNMLPRLEIIRGELARVAGRTGDALEAFNRASRAAQQNGSTDMEALALELAGELALTDDNALMARTYLRAARYAYERWGAHKKARQLIATHPFAAAQAADFGLMTTGMGGTHDAGITLDLEAATRASRAISEEIVLSRLLERIMRIVVENAGAERGVLVLATDSEPRIEASFALHGDETDGALGLGVSLGESTRVSEGVVRLVLATGRPVVLEDAARRGDFVRDAYVLARRPKSILCVPLENQGAVKGVLYLENNLARGAFTRDRIEMLQLLAAQAAVSIENARLYDELEAKVRERTRQLETRNEFIRKTFGRYLSDDVVDSILDAPHGLELGGELRNISVVIADLRGFSTAASRLRPEQVLHIVNNYLEVMTDVIFEYGGTIDEVLGDGLLVLFGAPLSKEDDANRAVACALAMQAAMTRVNARNRGMGLPELEMGIGIHTGEAVVGNIGSDKRAKYGVVGTVVNLAARIEALSTGGQVLISGATRDALSVELVSTTERSFEPKGASAPMTVVQVRSIGRPYDLALPAEDRVVHEVEGFAVDYTVITDDTSGATHAGRVVALSRVAMVIEGRTAVPLMSDVRIDLPEFPDERVYGKVTETAGEHRFVVRTTAMPEMVRDALMARLSRTTDRPPDMQSREPHA